MNCIVDSKEIFNEILGMKGLINGFRVRLYMTDLQPDT